MDFFKFKLSQMGKSRTSRFDHFLSYEDMDNPESSGLLPNENDYEFGTPSLNRNEDITLIASNSSDKIAIILSLKWRPVVAKESTDEGSTNSPALVSLQSKLTFVQADGSVYQYNQIETYQPSTSAKRPGKILQYGSNGSRLKMVISCPYRRVRVIFRGQMNRVSESSSPGEQLGEEVFVRLNLIVSPTSKIFDFQNEYNPNCFKTLYQANKPARSIQQALEELVLHDRHEYLIRIEGEYSIVASNQQMKRSTFFAWGFLGRHFSAKNEATPVVSSKRILAHFNNGRAFHLGSHEIDQDRMQFGYTCLELPPLSEPIEQPVTIDWTKIDSKSTHEFGLILAVGSNKFYECKARRRTLDGLKQDPSNNLFDIELDGKPGWATILCNDTIDSPQELEAFAESVADYRKSPNQLLQAGEQQTLDFATTKPLLVGIEEPICGSSDLVGSKASSLAQLSAFSATSATNANYVVPKGFVLTRFAHDSLIEQSPEISERIRQLEELIGEGDLGGLKDECARLQELIGKATLPQQVCDSISTRLSANYANSQVSFAVRSSSWGEDEEDMSAAGQLSTVLGVENSSAAIASAVLTCLASKFSYENVEYKRQHGLAPSLPMAVVVQEMVECEKAGVMFTCDPTSGDDTLITITANFGLGESVVSGQSDPDSIRVRSRSSDGQLTIEQVSIGQKKLVIDSNTLRGDQSKLDQYNRSQCCLNDEEILRLARCGHALASYFRCPRDIEWGYKGDQLFLFQSRPITGLDAYTEFELLHESDMPSRAEDDYATRANIGEVQPYPLRPMTLSYTIVQWSVSGARLLNRLMPGTKSCILCAQDLIYDSYHSFFNLRCSPIFPMQTNGGEKPLLAKSMEIGFFGHEIGDQPELVEASRGLAMPANYFSGSRYDLYTFTLRMAPITMVLREKQLLRKVRANVKSCKYATGYSENKMLGLYNQLKALPKFSLDAWENHICLIMSGSSANVGLMAVLANYIKDPVQLFTALSKFLAISPDVISAEIPQRIEAMSRLIRSQADQSELERFVQMTPMEALEYIQQAKGGEEVAKLFRDFMERFGHRCYNEFELGEQSWRQKPWTIAEMVQKNCKSPARTEPNKRATSIVEVIDSLELKGLTAKDRAMLRFLLAPKVQTMVAAREKTKDILIDFTDITREATGMLAREMRRNLRIPDEDLFYYLHYDDIEPLIRGPQPGIVVQAIRRRTLFTKTFSKVWKFDEIIQGHNYVPNHLKPSKELDEALANAPKLYGTPASSGRVQARVCLVEGFSELDKVRAGDILLTHSTDIAFSPVFPLVVGIITEVGGLISHGAVVAREYGLPSVLGIPDVTKILQDGEEIILDADNGAIIRLGKSLTVAENGVNEQQG